jgi:two-component system chemotaxis response regulator CheY
MKLLIVDDSSIMRMVIQKALAEIPDLEVVGQAGDGKKALEIFKEKLPDIVTMDITMPEMDGLTCMEEILKIKSDTKVLVVTALTKDGTSIQAIKKGAKGFITKPFTVEQMKEAFTRILS